MPERSLENEGLPQRLGSSEPGEPVPTTAKEAGCPSDQIIMVHVLFIDLVSYSLLKVDKGGPLVQEVFQIVSDTPECRRAKAAGELILLPSGDGAAIVFLSDPAAPVRCAEEIARAVSKKPDINLRMGVNSGPASWIVDINGNRIVAGAAINYAQRAMDCGDKGHILLTSSTAEYLTNVTEWANGIHELGTYQIKHQEVIRLFNFYTSEVGNPKRTARRSVADPREEPIFRRIFEGLKSWPRAISLASALAILAGAYWLLADPTPRALVVNRTPPGVTGVGYPQFSPDGHLLAYASKSSSGRWDVSWLNYDHGQFDRGQLSGNPQHPAGRCNGDGTEPAFSHDGKQIAFSLVAGPSFSPQGNLLDAGLDEQCEGIFVSDVRSSQVTKVAPRGYNPVWSANDKTILYASESIVRPEDRSTALSKLFRHNMFTGKEVEFFSHDAVQPSLSPNGRRVVFWFVKNGVRDLATIPADGGPAVPITNDVFMDWNPVWSRDGHVYFSSDRGRNGFQLWRIQVDEDLGRPKGRAKPVEVVVDPSEAGPKDVGNIAISQDGDRIAFVDRYYSAQLSRTQFDPGNATCDGPVESLAVSEPSTRPDLDSQGQWLVYNKRDGIFARKIDGSGESRLLQDEFINRGPRWSPDNRGRIAFFSNRKGKFEIWVGDLLANSLTLQPLTKSTGSIYPVWSPHGDRVAYTTWGPDLEPRTVISKVLDPLNPDPNPLPLEKPKPEFDGRFTVWSWSPDGKKLAGYRQRADGKFTGIFVTDAPTDANDSRKARHYTRLTSFGSDPVWLKDNHRLLFHYNGKIYVVDSALREPEKEVRLVLSVAPDEVARRGFSIDAENHWIYFSRETVANRLFVGTLDRSSNFSRILAWFNPRGD
jgi:Tol biopolymer transport system component/class 3 adenylate cyclase